MRAISGTSGSSGLGSHNREQMDKRTAGTNICPHYSQQLTFKTLQNTLVFMYCFTPVLKGLPLEIVNAGDHCDLRISKQMLPLLLIFG